MALDETALPLYKKLYREIKKNIESRTWEEGEKIPSEKELCEKYNVSRITVRRSISMLESDGLIKTVKGAGSFAQKVKYDQTLSKMVSFNKTLTEKGVKGSTKVESVDSMFAGFLIGGLLNLSAEESVLKITLVGEGDGKPIVQYESYFPLSFGLKVSEKAKEFEKKKQAFSTIDLYKEIEGNRPNRIKQTIEATIAAESLSRTLKVKEGTAILMVTSVIYFNEIPLEYRVACYLGSEYKFSTERTLQNTYS